MTGKTFGQVVAESIKGRTALLRDTRAEIVRLLKLAYDRISIILAGQPSDYQRWVLPQLQKEIALVLKEFGESGTTVMANAANSAWQAGLDLVDAPIRATGGAHVIAALGAPDTDQLNAMRLFMTDRIRNISLDAANRINGELGLVVIGAQSPGDAITGVNRILGGRARDRATTIVRTELGRVFSAASYARMQQAVANGANIRKKWIKSGKVHSRPGHDAIHGVILPIDQPFEVVDFRTGEIHKLMYPHDPRAPAGETINCGCVATPTASGFEGATFVSKVAKPDGGQWSKAELRAQARAFAAKNGLKEAFDPNQPRVASGQPGGGQWAKNGGTTEAAIPECVQQSFDKSNRLRILDLGPVENHAAILRATSLDVSGYRRSLDNYAVRHVMKKHGNKKAEAARGQIAVTANDFSLIPEITSSPDHIFHDGKNKIGRDVLVYAKTINGIGYRYVEEVRPGSKLLAADSLRKKKGAWYS